MNLYETANGTDRVRVTGRHLRPVTDEVLVTVEHRTVGGGRSILLSRQDVTDLHAALGGWLRDGWPGVGESAPVMVGGTQTDALELLGGAT